MYSSFKHRTCSNMAQENKDRVTRTEETTSRIHRPGGGASSIGNLEQLLLYSTKGFDKTPRKTSPLVSQDPNKLNDDAQSPLKRRTERVKPNVSKAVKGEPQDIKTQKKKKKRSSRTRILESLLPNPAPLDFWLEPGVLLVRSRRTTLGVTNSVAAIPSKAFGVLVGKI